MLINLFYKELWHRTKITTARLVFSATHLIKNPIMLCTHFPRTEWNILLKIFIDFYDCAELCKFTQNAPIIQQLI